MAHLFDQGFFVRKPAWHGLGTVITDYPGMEEAMKLAGHDHQIGERQLAVITATESTPLTTFKALVREDTGHVVSVMPSTYEVIQNKTPWEIIDTLFTEGAKWDTAGILKGRFDENAKEVKGQVYWCLSLLDEPRTVNGDDSPTYPYLAATWSHDGSQSLRIRAMSVRIVCANTHHAAMYGAGADLDISIRHVGDVSKRIEIAKRSLGMVRNAQQAYLDVANELASMPVNDAQIEAFVQTIVPMPEAGLITDRVRENIKKSRQQVRDLFNGHTIAQGIRNTAYGLVEAGVEYFDHCRRYLAKDSYFSRNVLRVEAAKANLITTAREIAATMAA